ncbi:MAG: serine/threonine-protein kinase [Pirellulaceae bacterium]|nr:serine/threonine-protein kinase [Pirellulaceae bacterium]
MNDQPPRCDGRRLDAMLQSDTPCDDQEELLVHLENCELCQHRLSENAASKEDWKRITEAIASRSGAKGAAPRIEAPTLDQQTMSWTESTSKHLLSPPSHPEMLGRLGRYEIEKLIGSGGMGIVFKAFDSELNRSVAIKMLAPYLSASGSARQRFSREARAAAAVVHQHVVHIHNVETDRDAPIIVMQYVSGESLQARIDREGPLELVEILRIGMQVADGLAAAHDQGLVHRDIKPANILLEEAVDRSLITDFGLARAVDDASLTSSGAPLGTPQYMSPEQALTQTVDKRSDLFSLGSTLYAMCTGRPPFRAETSLGVMRRITDSLPTPVREINPEIPEWMCQLIAKLMSKQKQDRFQNATEVHEVLEAALGYVQNPSANPLPKILCFEADTPHAFMKSSLGKIAMATFFAASVLFVGFLLSPGDKELPKSEAMRLALSNAKDIRVYEGLPHPLRERTLFAEEKERKDIKKIGSYWFYNPREVDNKDLLKRLQDLLSSPSTYIVRTPEIAVNCGPFHPDFAVEWMDGFKVCRVLVCFTCGEAMLSSDGTNVFYLLAGRAESKVKKLLQEFAKERP